ncbi:hypothetical protein Mgra_00007180 [Meloidogyne graminicola]|uniref:39S ribosomal protein L12, mitochondrial n=1 Tax=Meloidogyne graminicola TaxID=189291 RepID=A0A8S9ZJE3_9BILA|nr:hypothetical protein Mgra_00007180 [Meloidogyne graminicola]
MFNMFVNQMIIKYTKFGLQFTKFYGFRAFSSAASASEVSASSISKPVDERRVSSHIEKLVDEIASLSLVDVSDLNYALKKRLNINDQQMFPMAGMAVVPQKQGVQQPEEEAEPTKTSFAVKLSKYDDSKKVALIKEVRACVQGLNLVQAKKLVESSPVEIKTDLGMKEAEELKIQLEKAGAICEIL